MNKWMRMGYEMMGDCEMARAHQDSVNTRYLNDSILNCSDAVIYQSVQCVKIGWVGFERV